MHFENIAKLRLRWVMSTITLLLSDTNIKRNGQETEAQWLCRHICTHTHTHIYTRRILITIHFKRFQQNTVLYPPLVRFHADNDC